MTDELANLRAAVDRSKSALLAALHGCGVGNVSASAPARTLVRLARTRPEAALALHAFETAIRPALVDYVASVPKGGLRHIDATAQFLIEHFDKHTEVPITAGPVKRVVSWAKRNYRAWREGQ